MLQLVSEECPAKGLVATATAAVFPFHLDHPVVAAKSLVETCAVGCRLCRTELEVALVRVFIAAGIEPCIEIRISDGFFCFVCHHIGHAIRAAHARCRAVGTGGLDFAAAGALVSVANECPLDIGSVDSLMGVETAELGAESALFDVRGGCKDIDAVRIGRQMASS